MTTEKKQSETTWVPRGREAQVRAGRDWEQLSDGERVLVWVERILATARMSLARKKGEKPIAYLWDNSRGVPLDLAQSMDVLGWGDPRAYQVLTPERKATTADPLDHLVSEVIESLSAKAPDGSGNSLGLAVTNRDYALLDRDPSDALDSKHRYLVVLHTDVVDG